MKSRMRLKGIKSREKGEVEWNILLEEYKNGEEREKKLEPLRDGMRRRTEREVRGRTAHAAVAEAGCEDFVALFEEDAGGGVEEEDGAVAGDEVEFVDGREVVEASAADSGSINARKGSVL